MSTAFSGIAAHAVPAIWAFAAFYLVWGTEKPAPPGYPVGMAFVAGMLWLGTNEVPIMLANYGVTPSVVGDLLMITAAGVAVEMLALTISSYELGHRSPYIPAAIEWTESAWPTRDGVADTLTAARARLHDALTRLMKGDD